MEYIGAADYHFWNGVYMGYNGEGLASIEISSPSLAFDNEVSRSCLEAFKWGFYLGEELTEEEYISLTTMTKSNIIKKKAKPEKEIVNVKIEGNC